MALKYRCLTMCPEMETRTQDYLALQYLVAVGRGWGGGGEVKMATGE